MAAPPPRRGVVSWPPDMVATQCFLSLLRAHWPAYLYPECARDREKYRETPTGTHGHRETWRPQMKTETRRSIVDTAKYSDHFLRTAKHDNQFLTERKRRKTNGGTCNGRFWTTDFPKGVLDLATFQKRHTGQSARRGKETLCNTLWRPCQVAILWHKTFERPYSGTRHISQKNNQAMTILLTTSPGHSPLPIVDHVWGCGIPTRRVLRGVCCHFAGSTDASPASV